jgi:hypothetical protein
LNFDYSFEPYTYKNVLNNEYSEYRESTNIYKKGTKNVIGQLSIFTTITNKNGVIYGEVEHVYYLPGGQIRVVYINKNEMSSGGGFLPNKTFTAPIISGYGKYLGVKGYAKMKTNDTKIRKGTIVLK